MAAGTWNNEARTKRGARRERSKEGARGQRCRPRPRRPIPGQARPPLSSLSTLCASLQDKSCDAHFTDAETEAQRGANAAQATPPAGGRARNEPGSVWPGAQAPAARDAELRGERVRGEGVGRG